MKRTSLLCFIFFGIIGVSWSYENPSIIPVCANKGRHDVYLDFSNAALSTIPKSYMIDSSVTCLNLEGNAIREIEPNAFDGLPKLYYLNLAKNPLSFDSLIKIALPNLEVLILDGRLASHSRQVQPSHWRRVGTPTIFDDVMYGDYDGVDMHENINRERSFNLPKLRKLSLRFGSLDSRSDDLSLTVYKVPMLTHLYLSGNELMDIPNLSEMPNVTHLNLDDNKMKYMSGSFLKNLEYLSMDHNKIGNVCGTFCNLQSITLREMHNLKYLSLANNDIKNIGSDAFVDLENLHVLNLAGNAIEDFQIHAFDNMTKLQNLTLDKNNLAKVPDICALQELEVLSLNENNITVIDETTFCNMTKLAMVYLKQNGITTIVDMAFASLPNLAMLDLSWNSINFLPEYWISPNNNLKVLHLDGNEFTDILNMSLEHVHKPDTLSLGHNPIKQIFVRTLKKLADEIVFNVTLN